MEPEQLIRVTVKNWGRDSIYFVPVYFDTEDEEKMEYEEKVILKRGEEYEMPYPLQKDSGEADDGWMLQNDKGKTILSLIFKLEKPEAAIEKPEDVIEVEDENPT